MSVSRTVTPLAGHFPEGTAVQCFLKTQAEVERRESRTPIPAPAASGVISNGSVTLTGLEADTDYVLEAVVDEIQSLKVDATGGKYKLKYAGQETADIKYNASTAELESALVALSNIAEGDVKVTGGVGNSGGTNPYAIKFLKAWSGTDVETIEVKAGSEALSGGGAAATISTTTQGSKSGEGGKQRTCLFRTDAS